MVALSETHAQVGVLTKYTALSTTSRKSSRYTSTGSIARALIGCHFSTYRCYTVLTMLLLIFFLIQPSLCSSLHNNK